MSFVQLQFDLNKFSCQRELIYLLWSGKYLVIAGKIYMQGIHFFPTFHTHYYLKFIIFQDILPYIISEPQVDATVASASYIRASAIFLLVCAGNYKVRQHSGF